MIAKTLAGFIGGCLISISIMLNINYLLPVEVDSQLLIGLLVSFPVWVAAMVWGYASKDALQAWRRYSYILVISVGINAFYILGAA